MAKDLKGSPRKVVARLLVKPYPGDRLKRRLAVEIKKGRAEAYKLRPHWYYNIYAHALDGVISVSMTRSWGGQGRLFCNARDKQGRYRYEVGKSAVDLPFEFTAGTYWHLYALPGSTASDLRFRAVKAEEPPVAKGVEAAGDEPEAANPSPAPALTTLEQALAFVASSGCRLGKENGRIVLTVPEGHDGVPPSIVETLRMHREQLAAIVPH